MTWVGDSLFARTLRLLARLVTQYPQWFLYPQLLLFVVSIFYTIGHWKEDMDENNLVGGVTHQIYMNFRKEFPGEDELAVVVQSDARERNRQFVERLAARVEAETNMFTDVFYKGDLRAMGKKALLIAPEADLKDMQQILVEERPFIQEFTKANTLQSFFELINKQFRTAKREENAQNDALISAIPLLQRIVEQASDSLSRPGDPVSPGVTALFGNGEKAENRMYTTYAHGQIYLVTARPVTPEMAAKAVERLRQLMSETEIEVPGVNAGLTGKPVLDYDQMKQATKDSAKASVLTLLICSLLFIYAYHETGRPLKAVVCLVLGLGYTMAFTFMTVGHLNILTITFAPILIGLAIDFGIHFITRYEEEIRHGNPPAAAVERAMVFTGQGIITGALTTAMAFLAMGLTNFKGIQEMGIISGGGLVLCLIPMLTVLPILLLKGKQNAIDEAVALKTSKREEIENFWLERPVPVVAVTAVFCLAAAIQLKKVNFDYNLLDLQAKGLPAVVYENKLLFSGQSILSVGIVAGSLQEARQIEEKVKTLPLVASVDYDDRGDPIFDLLTRDQTAKLKMATAIKNEVSDMHFAPEDPDPIKVDDLCTTLYSTMGYLGLAADASEKERPQLADELRSLRTAISDFRVRILRGDPSIPERLEKFQDALFGDIRQTFEAIKNQDTSSRLTPDDLFPAAHNEFIGRTGKFKVEVFPKKDIWQHDNQRDFIDELKQALNLKGSEITGEPVQIYEYTTLLRQSYQQAAVYALVAIVIMVLIHFRSLPCVILSLLPVLIGSLWTVGLMGAFGIQFNPANIMTLPLVIGIGVTNGIHILNRVAEEQKPGILGKSTGKAVLVSGLTALTGFGSLTIAKDQGIQSLGFVMAIGIAACMIAGLTFLPATLNILARFDWCVAKKRPSSDNARSPLGLEEPR